MIISHLAIWALFPALALSAQHAFTSPPSPASLTLVDLISASPNHTLLVRAFQRARLIPALNRLNGSTLFAPTDDAIKAAQEAEGRGGVWSFALGHDDDEAPQRDNMQLALRDTLLYHLLNFTLFPDPSPPSNDSSTPVTLRRAHPDLALPSLHQTLYRPYLSRRTLPFPSPPAFPGELPMPDDPDEDDDEGLLGGEYQRVRVVRKAAKGKNGADICVGGDWKGDGGARGREDELVWARNGAMVVLDRVLSKPVDLGELRPRPGYQRIDLTTFHLHRSSLPAEQIRTNPSLSTLASLLPPTILDYLSTAPHFTLFAPTNVAWDALSELELFVPVPPSSSICTDDPLSCDVPQTVPPLRVRRI